MSKEYVLAVVCIFLLCISADYFFNISISLAAVSRTILKSLAGYFILSLLLGKGWFLLLKLIRWLLESTIGVIVLMLLGISLAITVPVALAWCIATPRK